MSVHYYYKQSCII